MTREFLTVQDVLDLHTMQLARHGGASGIRDHGLLESAVAQPQVTFDGDFVHDGLFDMAAAYLFHIVANHPFVDGNKRTGLVSALVFLDLNGIAIDGKSETLYDLTMSAARGKVGKEEIAAKFALVAALD